MYVQSQLMHIESQLMHIGSNNIPSRLHLSNKKSCCWLPLLPRYASELFGNIIGIGKPIGVAAPTGDERSTAASVLTREEASARLKTDFDRFYFVTGQMDLDLYEEDCTFADPFVAFQGRQRFKVEDFSIWCFVFGDLPVLVRLCV